MTWTLIGVNVLVFIYQMGLPEPELSELIYSFGLVPARYFNPDWALSVRLPSLVVWPFVSSMFLHGGLLHLVLNVWTLWIFGDNVEDRMGSLRFLAFYLSCGLVAGLAHLAFNLSSSVPTIGASGAIAGVLGAYLILYPGSRVITVIPIFFWPVFFELPAFIYLGFWFVSQFLSATLSTTAAPGAGGIAWWAHIGGFVAGLTLHRLFFSPRRRASRRRPARHFILPRSP
jgi:membrane associated rhomboid family serine protease